MTVDPYTAAHTHVHSYWRTDMQIQSHSIVTISANRFHEPPYTLIHALEAQNLGTKQRLGYI